jgi:predicted Zn-ribbon and HTH transcriptional regulator
MPICKKCNCNWISRVVSPVSCPNCKSRNWNGINLVREVKRLNRVCAKCGYGWLSHSENLPKQCPKCKSLAWGGAAVPVVCFMCGGAGCSVCRRSVCGNCIDRGMVRGCPSCGKVYII